MSRDNDRGGLVIGGPARANLLPPEVGLAAKGRVLRRNAIALIILAVLVVIAGYAGGTFLALGAQAQLDAATARTQALIAEQGKYAEVRQVTTMLETATAAKQVGTSTEIDWKAYLEDIQASLPAGTLVTNVVAETATPLSTFAQPAVPLQGNRIGELTFTATSKSLPDVEKWLQALAELNGYVDASPGSVSLNDDTGTYEVSITMHIDEDALLLRYDDEAREARDQARAEKEAAEKEAAEKEAAESTGDENGDDTSGDAATDGGE
jgi:Tfp pilus assembly protein PilN